MTLSTDVDALLAQTDARLAELADETARLKRTRSLLADAAASLNGHEAVKPTSPTKPVKPGGKRGSGRGNARPKPGSGRAKPGEIPEAIIGLLADGVARPPKQIAAELGYPTPKVSSAITGLHKDSRIEHPADGRGWTLPTPASA